MQVCPGSISYSVQAASGMCTQDSEALSRHRKHLESEVPLYENADHSNHRLRPAECSKRVVNTRLHHIRVNVMRALRNVNHRSRLD